jgi:microcystin-dependent protein
MSSIFSFFKQSEVDVFDNNTDFPVGSIVAIPSIVSSNSNYLEWLLCDGSSVSKTEYSNLYAVIGDIYGSTTTNFNIPDLSNYAIKGCDDDDTLNSNTSISDTASLSNYVSHTHSINNVTSGSGTSNVSLTMTFGKTNIQGGGGGVQQFAWKNSETNWDVQVYANGSHSHSIDDRTSNSVGSSNSFSIKPKNILMAYYIKS